MDGRYVELIERIKNAQFRTTRFSPGYDEEEVDDLLDRVVDILRDSDLPDPQELRNAQFTTRRLRPSYVMKDVDDLLQEIAEAAARM
jgi:DivIVA domain-containing protein